jgi:hypothetical protein
MYSWPMTSQESNPPRDCSVATEHVAHYRAPSDATDDVLEVPLLLSRQQMLLLAQAAEQQGMTSAQYLRRCISTICSHQLCSHQRSS